MDDRAQFEVINSEEQTVLEKIGTRIVENLADPEFSYHTQSGVTVTFTRPKRESEE